MKADVLRMRHIRLLAERVRVLQQSRLAQHSGRDFHFSMDPGSKPVHRCSVRLFPVRSLIVLPENTRLRTRAEGEVQTLLSRIPILPDRSL